MPKKSKYIAKRDADREGFFVAGCDTATQQMFDMMCLALHDPNVMGKDTFGAERLKKLHKALFEYEEKFHEAWIGHRILTGIRRSWMRSCEASLVRSRRSMSGTLTRRNGTTTSP